jgi:hypothetical protein
MTTCLRIDAHVNFIFAALPAQAFQQEISFLSGPHTCLAVNLFMAFPATAAAVVLPANPRNCIERSCALSGCIKLPSHKLFCCYHAYTQIDGQEPKKWKVVEPISFAKHCVPARRVRVFRLSHVVEALDVLTRLQWFKAITQALQDELNVSEADGRASLAVDSPTAAIQPALQSNSSSSHISPQAPKRSASATSFTFGSVISTAKDLTRPIKRASRAHSTNKRLRSSSSTASLAEAASGLRFKSRSRKATAEGLPQSNIPPSTSFVAEEFRQDLQASFWMPYVSRDSTSSSASQSRCAALIAAALVTDAPLDVQSPDGSIVDMAAAHSAATLHAPTAVAAVAAAVERSVAASYPALTSLASAGTLFGPTKEESTADRRSYAQHIKSLVFNLKAPGNCELRARVLSGRLPPAALASMTSAALATPEVAKAVAKARKDADAEFVGNWTYYGHACVQCGGVDTSMTLLSVRRDIGKSETWGSKELPAAVIKAKCNACGAMWEAEGGM